MSTLTPTAAPDPTTRASTFAGTLHLTRLIGRRERRRLTIWVIAVPGLLVATVASLADLFADPVDRAQRAELMSAPMMRAFNGPGYGLDDYTLGALVANELLLLVAIAVALMSILLVVRHTRAEEEEGRTELLRASVVGAHAPMTAALLVALAANLLIALVTALALTVGFDELGGAGSWSFALSVAATGAMFAALAALAAQVTEHARAATGYASVTLGVAVLLRAIGDVGGPEDRALAWASPVGWAQSTRPFVAERWWPLLLCIAFALTVAVVAAVVATRRDVGAGLVRPRPGPARAAGVLAHPVGLAARLQRGGLAAWGVGLLLLGAGFGSVTGDIEEFIADNPQLEQVLGSGAGGAPLDAFLSMVLFILALLATGYGVGAAGRLRTEEATGRAEALLVAGLTRHGWAGAHVGLALVGSALVLVAGSFGLGATVAVQRGEVGELAAVLGSGLASVPAVWLVIAVLVALVGLLPRAAAAAWVLLVYAAVVGLTGDLLGIPEGAQALSPLHHAAVLPLGDVSAWPPVLAAVLAAAGVAAGLYGLARRDVNTT